MVAMSYYLLILLLVNAVYTSFRVYIEIRKRIWEKFI